MQLIQAKLNYLRMPPRKVRLIVDAVRGMDAEEADVRLSRMVKSAAEPILKLLRSAIANAENNFKQKKLNLFIQAITVDKRPVLKRFRPRAFGRAADIHKHTSHVVFTLGVREVVAKKKFAAVADKKEKKDAGLTLDDMSKKKEPKEKNPEKEVKAQKTIGSIGKRIFRRKSV
jgi:large subunit ribosomal protein L22